MRIRKRTPARAASPPGLSPSLPSPPKEVPRPEEEEEEDDAEEKRVILEDISLAPPLSLSQNNSAATDGEPKRVKPETELRDLASDKARCSRNDGKRWRCKSAAVPGFLFCDRHVAWSVRQRQPRTKKKKSFQPAAPTKEQGDGEAEEHKHDGPAAAAPRHDVGDGFQTGSVKRARGGGPGPGP